MSSEIIAVPIKFGAVTLLAVMTKTYPVNYGNCFSLIDPSGESHKVVNFCYENLREWMRSTKQTDIKVRCIPKSDKIWEIADDRIPKNWYSNGYCTVCTPIRMLPRQQRIEYLKNKTFKKYIGYNGDPSILISSKVTSVKPSGSPIQDFSGYSSLEPGFIYAPYTPRIKK